MRVIALMNQKGGVGKTTTTVNLGAALAEAGKRVCLIDLDPQAHLTINYGIEPANIACSLYDVLVENKPLADAIQKIEDKICVIPSSIDLAAAEVHLVNQPGRDMILRDSLESLEKDFDFILIDCPPSLGLLTVNALAAANEVLIPMQPHFLALQGVAKLLETVQLVNRRINPRLKVAGIVLTMFDAQTKLSVEVVNELNAFIDSAKGKPLPWAGAKIFNSKIRRNIKLAESPSFGQTIFKYDPASHGATDYRNLAGEILGIAPVTEPARPPAIAKPAAGAPKPASPAGATEPTKTPIAAKPAIESSKPAPVAKPTTTDVPAAKPVVRRPTAVNSVTVETSAKTDPPKEAAKPPVKPVVRKAPSPPAATPVEVPPPAVSVTVNPAIDATRLAAAKAVAKPASPASPIKINPAIEAPKLAAARLIAKTPTRKAPAAVTIEPSKGSIVADTAPPTAKPQAAAAQPAAPAPATPKPPAEVAV